jgi:uncharacterized protein
MPTEETRVQIDWDVPILMDDGLTLRANVFRPDEPGRVPTLLTCGPYGKDLSFQEGYAPRWRILERDYPDAVAGSSNVHASWELVDPEKWVGFGYAVVRVDSRGAGRSAGVVDCWSARETTDLAACVSWAGEQEWSNGRVGLTGVSYYAMNAWQLAASAEAPPALAAVCCWEGCNDHYREAAYHGGIRNSFLGTWAPRQVESVQHGAPNPARNPVSGLRVTGDIELPAEDLAANRVDVAESIRSHPLLDDYWTARSADLAQVRVPVLSAGNWGGHGLHLRGNVQGFTRNVTPDRWLEIHGREHWSEFYTEYGVGLQRRFFDHFLKDEGDWRTEQPPVQLQIRRPDDTFRVRAENEWPLARTDWQTWHLDAAKQELRPGATPAVDAAVGYDPFGEGVTFWAPAFDTDVEITGPLAAKLFVSSETADADLFLVVRAFDPDGAELLFRGAGDPFTPMAQGWLRASHRALDTERSTPWQPVHPHDRTEPLTPGTVYELDVEIWPTCLELPAGYRIALTVLGRDYDHGLTDEQMAASGRLGWSARPTRGCGPYVHVDADDRRPELVGGRVTVHTGPGTDSRLLLPFVPTEESR